MFFWAKGYEGAALSDLTRAMRINRPSLYAAFGNKEQLFRKVLDRYAEGPFAYFEKALAANSLKKSGRRLILNSHRACSPENSSGITTLGDFFLPSALGLHRRA